MLHKLILFNRTLTLLVVLGMTSPAFAVRGDQLPLPPAYVPPPPANLQTRSAVGPTATSAPSLVTGTSTLPPADPYADAPVQTHSAADIKALNDLINNLSNVSGQVQQTTSPPICSDIQAPAPSQSQSSPSSTGRAANMKDESELVKYATCYSDHPEWTKAYVGEYSKYIHTAALQFGVPETLLTCLLFRESQFNPRAESQIFRRVRGRNVQVQGAVGIAQFMPDTEEFVTSLISSGDMSRAKVESLTDIVTSREPDAPKRDVVYAQTALDNYQQASRWGGYFDQLKSQGLYHGNTPTEFTSETAKNPKIAIGASAFYLRYMMELFQDELSHNQLIANQTGKSPDIDFMLTIAGSYNMGHGSAVKKLRNVKPATSRNWYNRLMKSNSETQGHMRSIRNCVENGNFAPSDGTPPRDCSSGTSL